MFEWDPNKERQNRLKHGVAFADTYAIFADPSAMTIEDIEHNEQRFTTLGRDGFGRLLVVTYTWRDENIRLISARKATAQEVKQYEKQL